MTYGINLISLTDEGRINLNHLALRFHATMQPQEFSGFTTTSCGGMTKIASASFNVNASEDNQGNPAQYVAVIHETAGHITCDVGYFVVTGYDGSLNPIYDYTKRAVRVYTENSMTGLTKPVDIYKMTPLNPQDYTGYGLIIYNSNGEPIFHSNAMPLASFGGMVLPAPTENEQLVSVSNPSGHFLSYIYPIYCQGLAQLGMYDRWWIGLIKKVSDTQVSIKAEYIATDDGKFCPDFNVNMPSTLRSIRFNVYKRYF